MPLMDIIAPTCQESSIGEVRTWSQNNFLSLLGILIYCMIMRKFIDIMCVSVLFFFSLMWSNDPRNSPKRSSKVMSALQSETFADLMWIMCHIGILIWFLKHSIVVSTVEAFVWILIQLKLFNITWMFLAPKSKNHLLSSISPTNLLQITLMVWNYIPSRLLLYCGMPRFVNVCLSCSLGLVFGLIPWVVWASDVTDFPPPFRY